MSKTIISSSSSSGIGFGGALFLVFFVLKVTHVIDWSWWWVTAPLWIPIALFLVFAGVLLLIAAVFAAIFGSSK